MTPLPQLYVALYLIAGHWYPVSGSGLGMVYESLEGCTKNEPKALCVKYTPTAVPKVGGKPQPMPRESRHETRAQAAYRRGEVC